ncbi:hypothetical protein BC939DRAFT_441865 [Gamsiella multidivaricata]|uniref:uncharacterized protein n=1 Tax=Gamsiella multidivaricata TaxID=101098 RepID=UPI0022201DF1|nr:uncharacterized protein BC939DRAFT_441865 [Gamsiella multidivaricata]KAG0362065.1 hypothetical protein BGZ54_008780 [Gamsiella multidivaricata]KAI7829433.1 hypothetical protein BC939DRAFT_441865 [Gamsiella multidivaricata]
MSNDVYSRISERMKNEHFTEEEIRIVGKAKEQLSSYATGGSVIGGLGGLALAKAKNFKGLQGMAIATGGFLIGSQLGLVMGAMASVKTIQSIPNFQRILNIVQEVREEAPGSGGSRGPGGPIRHDHAATMPSAGHQRFPVQPRRSELMSDDAVEQQSQQFQEFKNGDGYHGGNDPNGSALHDQSSAWARAQQRAKEIQSNSPNWNQIRQMNMPKSAWNDIRDGRHASTKTGDDGDEDTDDTNDNHARSKQSPPVNSKRRSAWDRMRQGDADGFVSVEAAPDGPSEFPRTREDLESRPSRQKNQYGDAL